jgi:3-oxoacyl-[acyl-carrier-protein] synthase II
MTSHTSRRPEVVVTGLGATTPLGGDVASTWEAMLAGRSGVGRLTQDWAEQLPVRIAASLAVEPSEVLDRVKLRRLDRSEAAALVAAHEAWNDAGLAGADLDTERLAVSVGSGIGGATTLLAQDDILEASGPRKVSPHTVPMLMPNGPAAWVGLELGAKAGVHCVASACATGAEAIALGLDIIRSGRADVVVAGGTEAVIHPLPIAGFAAMRAMSTRNDEPEKASRPWDKARDGFVLGEGAGAVVLERADLAAARGARVYARLAGAGLTSDGFDIVQPHPEGLGASRAIALALRDADMAGADIVHVNAHATSTPVGDMAEIVALRATIGDHPVLTATKSMSGHLLGAAGALESIATILAIRDGVVPPTINLDDPDDGLDLDVAAHKARHLDIPAALNNSFGFGGHNVALVFTRA